ncbi:MAG: DUF5685 family protein [Eubacteriales bacterium]|nr:DUF5685 family protein [Eubacteriales bacterium]
MYGYVRAIKDNMTADELDRYQGYYCGLCKELGARYGQKARMLLSYDMTFLALLLSSVNADADNISREKCILHHIKAKPVIKSKYNAYAADMTVILAYEKMRDDRQDGKAASGAALKIFAGAYAEACGRRNEAAALIRSRLEAFYRAEKAEEKSCDLMADLFAEVMKVIFSGCDEFNREAGERRVRVMAEAGSSLGRWIYLIDALDDFRDDMKSGNYNPLVMEYGEDRDSAAEDLRPALYRHLGLLGQDLDLLDPKKDLDLIENITYLGLRAKTEEIIKGQKDE